MEKGEKQRIQRIESLDDARVAAYRNLKDRELAASGERFIAEGELVVRRLIESDYPVESLLLTETRQAEFGPLVAPETAVYVAPARVLSAIVGFRFHLGVLACGRRKAMRGIDEAAAAWPARAMLVVLPDITNLENLGAILRVASVFGADAVLLGPGSCDPFYRQCVRTSMGQVFHVNLVWSVDVEADLRRLRDERGFELAAAVIEAGAEPLHTATRAERFALVLGNEDQGVAPGVLALCRRRITIPMRLGTDSLNVAVAAALFLYHFRLGGLGPAESAGHGPRACGEETR